MAITDKISQWFGFEDEFDDEYEEITEQPKKEVKSRVKAASNSSARVSKIVVLSPERFNEVQTIVDHLKNNRQVILNLENTQPEISRRIIDFVCGATYALDGHSQQSGKNVYLFTSSSIQIIMENKKVLFSKDLVSTDY